MQITDQRPDTRIPIDVLAELCVDGVSHPAVIHRISQYGAFLRCDHEQFPGADVELAIASEREPRIITAATIVYRVGAAEASKLGTVAGVGVRYCDPFCREAELFGSAVEQLHASRNLVAAKPTRRLRGTVASNVLEATSACSEPDQPAFSGSLAGLGVPPLLCLLESARKTGRLVLGRGHLTVTLEFSDGQIVGVQSTLSDDSHPRILMIVAGWTEGRFEFASIAPPRRPVGRRLRLSVTKLLLAHAAVQDRVAAGSRGP